MPSLLWKWSPQKAMDRPYEYKIKTKFLNEATEVINKHSEILGRQELVYYREERTIKKAIWMLVNDAFSMIGDIHFCLLNKRHKIASSAFRTIDETIDMATYFYSNTEKSNKHLEQWYNDEIIRHAEARNHYKKQKGEHYAEILKNNYRTISKYSHRTYLILMYGYSLGKEDKLVYDGHTGNDFLVLPHTLMQYCAILAQYIRIVSQKLTELEVCSRQEVDEIWTQLFQTESDDTEYMYPEDVVNKVYLTQGAVEEE